MSVRLTDCQKKLSSPKKVIIRDDRLAVVMISNQNSDSYNFQEEERKAVPDSPGKSMLMKFIDCSGTDITEKVKEVNEKELEARLKEDFLIPVEEEETDESSDVKEPEVVVDLQQGEEEADLEVLEISHPKVQEVLIVLDEDEDKAGFDCILEKVDSSPEKVEPGKVAGENVQSASAVEMLPEMNSKEEKVSQTKLAPVSKSFEEEFSRFSSQRKATPAESEVDSDTDKGKEREGNFSADDENDEESGSENILVANSSAWSSLSLILEPQVGLQSYSSSSPQDLPVKVVLNILL